MHPKSLATDEPSAADAKEGALPGELLRGFQDHGLDLSVPRGTVVVREGDVADRLYLVREGRLRVYTGDGEGREVELTVLGPGRYFGELMLGSGLRTASVRALTASRPDVAFHVIQTLVARVRALTDDVRRLALMDVYERVVVLLTQAAIEADGMRVAPFMSQQAIAERVGASRSMVNRIMNDLIAGEYLEVTRDRIVLRRALPRRW